MPDTELRIRVKGVEDRPAQIKQLEQVQFEPEALHVLTRLMGEGAKSKKVITAMAEAMREDDA